jgi:GTP-binding protein
MNSPKVIIVGKPNVGKSTLFNKLCKKRLAIVHDRPGVTRDIKKFKATLAKMSFTLVDTAGIEASKDELNKAVLFKTKSELESADLLLFMVDGRRGIDASDREIAKHIRKLGKKVILVANKYEGGTIVDDSELYRFGFGDPVKISAEHMMSY